MKHYLRTLTLVAAVLSLFLMLVLSGGCRQTCPVPSAEKPQDFRTWSTNDGQIGVSGTVETTVVVK